MMGGSPIANMIAAALMSHGPAGGGMSQLPPGANVPLPRPRPPNVELGMPEPVRPRPWIDGHAQQQDDYLWRKPGSQVAPPTR